MKQSRNFAGLDDIDWASMRHAYGSAAAVPDAVRGMIAKKKRRRAWAQDYMVGAVHHQGDVYECTVAAIPFLVEAASRPGRRGRASVLKLLAGIGGAEVDDLRAADDRLTDLHRRAQVLVDAAGPALLPLLDDPHRKVRRAVPSVLLACRSEAGEVLTALQRRLSVEPERKVRAALVAAVATIGRRATAGLQPGVDGDAVQAKLWAAVEQATDPALQLAALTEVVRGSDSRDTGMAAPMMVALAGAVGGDARTLSEALGDRVTERIDLLVALLCHPDRARRTNAIWAAGPLMDNWRGPHEELVYLVGEQLREPDPKLRMIAARRLANLGALAAPAAEALADAVESWPEKDGEFIFGEPPGLFRTGSDGTIELGSALQALAGLHDRRALPALIRAVTGQPPAKYIIVPYVAEYGSAVAELVPWARRQLTVGDQEEIDDAIHLLGFIGAPEAVPDLIAQLPNIDAIRALGRIGPPAADAAAPLRRLPAQSPPRVAFAAAEALRSITGEDVPVLPLLRRVTDPEDLARFVAEIGPAAAEFAPPIRTLMDAPETHPWSRISAAKALWRLNGQAEELLPTLLDVWRDRRYYRGRVADLVAEMGPASAPVFGPLLVEEVTTAWRTTASTNSWISSQVIEDEKTSASCRAALTALGLGMPAPASRPERSPDALAALLRDARLPVRRHVPAALMSCGAQARDVLTVLRDRSTVEPDPPTRQAILDAVETLGRRAAAGFIDLGQP